MHAITNIVVVPAVPSPGVRFEVKVTVRHRKLDDAVGVWLDETQTGLFQLPPDYVPATCADSGLRSVEETLTFTATYKTAGVHHAPVSVVGCGPQPDPRGDTMANIDVEGPPAPTNGPHAPAFIHADRTGTGPGEAALPDPSQTYIMVFGEDADGLVTEFLVDWGDGSPIEYVAAPTTDDEKAVVCDPTREYGGSDSQVWAPHHYPTEEPRTVTVTVVSTGCNGTDPRQETTTTFPI